MKRTEKHGGETKLTQCKKYGRIIKNVKSKIVMSGDVGEKVPFQS